MAKVLLGDFDCLALFLPGVPNGCAYTLFRTLTLSSGTLCAVFRDMHISSPGLLVGSLWYLYEKYTSAAHHAPLHCSSRLADERSKTVVTAPPVRHSVVLLMAGSLCCILTCSIGESHSVLLLVLIALLAVLRTQLFSFHSLRQICYGIVCAIVSAIKIFIALSRAPIIRYETTTTYDSSPHEPPRT